jgi:hypothetical protein
MMCNVVPIGIPPPSRSKCTRLSYSPSQVTKLRDLSIHLWQEGECAGELSLESLRYPTFPDLDEIVLFTPPRTKMQLRGPLHMTILT